MEAKLYWSEDMPPDSNSNPQDQIKTTRNSNKMVNTTNSINTYLLAFLLSVPIKVIKVIKIIYSNYCWVEIYPGVICVRIIAQ